MSRIVEGCQFKHLLDSGFLSNQSNCVICCTSPRSKFYDNHINFKWLFSSNTLLIKQMHQSFVFIVIRCSPLTGNDFSVFVMHAFSDLHFCLHVALESQRVITRALCRRPRVPVTHTVCFW